MLLMALNVCWTAAMTNRNLAQGSQTVLGSSGVPSGPLSKKQNQGLFWGGKGYEYKEQAGGAQSLRREEGLQSRLVVDNGVKSFSSNPSKSLVTPAKRRFPPWGAGWARAAKGPRTLVCALMSRLWLRSRAERPKLEFRGSRLLMEHGGAGGRGGGGRGGETSGVCVSAPVEGRGLQ